MDPLSLAAGLVSVLAPLLPRLTGIAQATGEAAAGQVGKQLGDAAARGATSLWDRLWPRLRDRDDAARAVRAVAAAPEAASARSALTLQISELIASDPELARATADVLRQAGGHGPSVNAGDIDVSGNRNVVQLGGTNVTIGEGHDVHVGDRRAT